jgi:hypothetical protein
MPSDRFLDALMFVDFDQRKALDSCAAGARSERVFLIENPSGAARMSMFNPSSQKVENTLSRPDFGIHP